MSEGIKILLSLSLSGTLLTLILFLFKYVYKNKLSKRWQYYIWLIVIVRLLVPFTPETSFVGNLFKISKVSKDEQSEKNDFVISIQNNKYSKNTNTVDNEFLETEKFPVQNWIGISGTLICFIVWLVVAISLLIRKITIYQSFVKYIKSGQIEISDMSVWEQVGKLLEQNKVKAVVGLYMNSLISSPLLIGFFKPCIMLPTTELSASDFEYTILHELTHYKRKDMFYKWLVQFTICIHWFNPLVYLMSREISRACELSCDEAIIRKLDFQGRTDYGNTLINAMTVGGVYKDSISCVTLTESKKLLEERLDAIMNFKKNTSLVASIILTCFLCFGTVVVGAYPVQSKVASSDSNINKIATDYVLQCTSEKIIVKQGGTDFKIEVDDLSKDNYTIRDNRNVPMAERNYKFNKWDIIFERKKDLNLSAPFSSTVTLTIPNSFDEQYLLLITKSGDIHIENLDKVNLIVESTNGNIFIDNTNATDISASSDSGNIQFTQVTSTGDIETRSNYGSISIQLNNSDSKYSVKVNTTPKASIIINDKNYSGGVYTIGDEKEQLITLNGINNNFALSNIKFSSDDSKELKQEKQVKGSYWTEAEFSIFMEEQKLKYKELLLSGDITQEEYDTYISTDMDTFKEIQKGVNILKSATGSIENAIGEEVYTYVVLSTTLTGGDGSYSKRFEVPSDLPFFKLWLENTCGTRITYTVTKITDSGEVVIGPYTLDSGKQDTKFGYKSINDGGTFYVNVTSSDGRELSGNVGVRVSNRKFNELQQ